ncbi:MAG: four helix bundle protein [Candidatus Moranbacteria bacterium]|nr:four helix bundle protein [Candidatus Moranbacteria bacterium]
MKQKTENKIRFHDALKIKMDLVIHKIYSETKNFPKEEIYGVTSQLRRSALSIILNYIEGYARNSRNSYRNFLEISYGSLKETKYLVYFSHTEKYICKKEYDEIMSLLDEIGAMLWKLIESKK